MFSILITTPLYLGAFFVDTVYVIEIICVCEYIMYFHICSVLDKPSEVGARPDKLAVNNCRIPVKTNCKTRIISLRGIF